jgi:hypothetical protein
MIYLSTRYGKPPPRQHHIGKMRLLIDDTSDAHLVSIKIHTFILPKVHNYWQGDAGPFFRSYGAGCTIDSIHSPKKQETSWGASAWEVRVFTYGQCKLLHVESSPTTAMLTYWTSPELKSLGCNLTWTQPGNLHDTDPMKLKRKTSKRSKQKTLGSSTTTPHEDSPWSLAAAQFPIEPRLPAR